MWIRRHIKEENVLLTGRRTPILGLSPDFRTHNVAPAELHQRFKDWPASAASAASAANAA